MHPKKSCKTYKVKTDRTERKNRQIHNFRWIFNISLSQLLIRQWNKTISKDIKLNKTINQQDLVKTYRTLHVTTAEYTFISSTYRAYTKINHILGQKTNLRKFKTIEIIQSVFSDDNEIKLETNNRKIT